MMKKQANKQANKETKHAGKAVLSKGSRHQRDSLSTRGRRFPTARCRQAPRDRETPVTAARTTGRGSLWAEFCGAGPLRVDDVRRGGECGSRVSRTCFGSYTIFERVGSVPSSQLARRKSGIAVLFPGDMAPSLPSVVVLLLCVTLVPCVFGMF